MTDYKKEVAAYRKHKHLKLAASELGIPWQTLYVRLRAANEPVVGDKSRYGSETDKTAAAVERLFLKLVPDAEDMNRKKFQSKVDFSVYGFGVDVKACRARKDQRMAFSVKKQRVYADFFVCFGLTEENAIEACLLIPGEVARNHGTISLNLKRTGKWWAYEVDPGSLASFFKEMKKVA